MSAFNDIDIACEQCGEEFRGTIWTAVHAGQDPELKDLLLGGELNLVMCPSCAHVAYQDHFLLYQDPEEELVAYVYPPDQEVNRETLQAATMAGFSEAQSVYEEAQRKTYRPILVFGLETLVEMLTQEQPRIEQSDIAEAIGRQQAWPHRLLRPAEARERSLMRFLPLARPGEADRSNVLEGIDRLLRENPALDLYAALRQRIQSDPSWTLG